MENFFVIESYVKGRELCSKVQLSLCCLGCINCQPIINTKTANLEALVVINCFQTSELSSAKASMFTSNNFHQKLFIYLLTSLHSKFHSRVCLLQFPWHSSSKKMLPREKRFSFSGGDDAVNLIWPFPHQRLCSRMISAAAQREAVVCSIEFSPSKLLDLNCEFYSPSFTNEEKSIKTFPLTVPPRSGLPMHEIYSNVVQIPSISFLLTF